MTQLNVTTSTEIAEQAVGQHQAMQKPGELARLLDLLVAEGCRSVLEIGSYRGGVLWACAQALPDASLLGVDIDQHSPGSWCDWIVGDSHASSTLQSIDGDSWDAIFVDGDHGYEGVKQDWETYRQLVAPGGLFVFHDICEHPPQTECHVSELWAQLRTGEDTLEIVEPPANWGGLGVVRR